MNSFIYHIPTKIYFGENQLHHLPKEVRLCGKRLLLAYGGGSIKASGLYDRVIGMLEKEGVEVFELPGIAPNPRVDSVREGARICKEHDIDVVLAVGGGSTIDCAKWVAAAACVEFDAWDFFNAEQREVEKALPVISILTIAATGSEMDPIGVISNPETNEKFGKSSPLLYPKVSFLDPTLTYSVGRFQTACGCADILSHICEMYFTKAKDLDMLDEMMEGLMRTVVKFSPVALEHPDNHEARANLMWAASWAINGFINGGKEKVWSCHPMEHELSAFYDITHGLGLAIITPRWLRYCLNDTTVGRIARFGRNVFGITDKSDYETAELAIKALAEFLYGILGLQSTLTEIGIDDSKFGVMATKACKEDSIKGFITLRPADVVNIYRLCL